MSVAFRCNNCGNLEPSGAAGERMLPAACSICGHGVGFDPVTGIKHYDDSNWAVLSEASEKDLKEWEKTGLARDAIETHTPMPAAEATREPQSIGRATSETLSKKDTVA